MSLPAADDYQLGTDSMRQEDVPQGKITKHAWTSKIFPGTVRDYWIYVPAQYDGKTPAFEYDTLSDHYARFLEMEILPEVGKSVKLRQDAAGRAIGGISSGGICAFTVAWERRRRP